VSHLRILIADDSKPLLELIRQLLAHDGHAVTTATGGNEAMKLLKGDCFDLVIADVHMPDGDGFELVAELRKKYSATKILAISGGSLHFTPTYYTGIAKKLGAHATLLKPFDREQLLEGIANAMDSQNM
jgi:CheY-like chemotaxis protein